MWELTKSFRFEAAHSLTGTTLGPAGDEIHGHSFRAEVAVRGEPDPATGMVVDLGVLEANLETVRKLLDHKMLNRVAGLDRPTLEHLARFIHDRLPKNLFVARVTVYRDSSSEACSYVPLKADI
jgi:6-pyruvoyltetrahydropterin/6-carboxytetrahydropterin synthase